MFMSHSHLADNPFHADCLKLMQKLRHAPYNTLSHSVLLKRMAAGKRLAISTGRPIDTSCLEVAGFRGRPLVEFIHCASPASTVQCQ